MRTIGAKELRLNLDRVLDRVLNGEEILVNHRFKNPIRLSPVYPRGSHSEAGNHAGLHAFDAAQKRPSPFNSKKSLKELYDSSISKKYVG